MTYSRDAIDHFTSKLRFETDPSDVFTAIQNRSNFVLVDSRGAISWQQGRAAFAIHLPTVMIADQAAELIPLGTDVVVYCWGPGCNGATRAALEFARLGYAVKEMIGGFEYWAKEGFPVVDDNGVVDFDVDPLAAPIPADQRLSGSRSAILNQVTAPDGADVMSAKTAKATVISCDC